MAFQHGKHIVSSKQITYNLPEVSETHEVKIEDEMGNVYFEDETRVVRKEMEVSTFVNCRRISSGNGNYTISLYGVQGKDMNPR